ncbi:MAG TPA: hypothetical protein VLL56_10455 [Terriglobia bacterium]|nr:hypothetical protein [Terriglobia bacterium]
MSYPRISVFARLANGTASATRVIEGQETLQARTSHDISVDSMHDEIATPNPFAQAILFFAGGAKGAEPPIRIIQGPKTMLNYSDNVTLDPVHREAYVAQLMNDAILVFRSDAGGDVAPIRVIHGPKTKLDRPVRVSVDPVNNLMAVTTIQGVLFFNRTDEGDVAPKWVISGPKTGLGVVFGTRKVIFSPEGKKIIATGRRGGAPTGELFSRAPEAQPFIGIWNYGDNGDVAPWAIMPDHAAYSMDLNPAAKELITVDRGKVVVYRMPELFQ